MGFFIFRNLIRGYSFPFMQCLITAGPTQEPLDSVRRLTNHSTGLLGSHLANFLESQGYATTLFLGEGATYGGPFLSKRKNSFQSTKDLQSLIHEFAKRPNLDAIFHVAAVSDFSFGKVYQKQPDGSLAQVKQGKFSTRQGSLFTELIPTPKLISELRLLFPKAWIAGWKYEVDDTQKEAIQKGFVQIKVNKTNACVVNGPAYGHGFGFLLPNGQIIHCPTKTTLFQNIHQTLQTLKIAS